MSASAGTRHTGQVDGIKLKCNQRQEFVVGGYTRGKGATAGLNLLLLGVYGLDGSLRYAGRVEPYLSKIRAAAFVRRAQRLERDDIPFSKAPRRERGGEYVWLELEMVCDVAFLEWTKSGALRHRVFHAPCEDESPRAVTREQMVDVEEKDEKRDEEEGAAPVAGRRTPAVSGVKISNADRVVDQSAGHTKLEVVRYYEAIAEWALQHLHNRPLALLRAPGGIVGEQFFQKRSESFRIPRVDELPVELHPGHAPLMVAHSQKALVGLAQMRVLELHTWNAVAPDLTHPDRIIFDLAPDPALPWSAMLEAARLLRVVLDELGLESFPKTSGGKGLHVVVPLTRKHSWAEAKDFSRAVAQHIARVVPARFFAVSGPTNRVGKIFIEYLRNSKGASTVAAFSVRARPGIGVGGHNGRLTSRLAVFGPYHRRIAWGRLRCPGVSIQGTRSGAASTR